MKASDIKNKALAEILAFAVFEFTNIVDYLTSKGEIDPDIDTYDAYIKDFGVTEQVSFGVWVSDTYTCEMSYEERYLAGFQFDLKNKRSMYWKKMRTTTSKTPSPCVLYLLMTSLVR